MTRSPDNRAPRLSLAERGLLLMSQSRSVDGLWIGTAETEADLILGRVEQALGLIKTYDPCRYDRILQDLDRIWVRLLPGPVARFQASIRACELDPRPILRGEWSPEVIAATIAHEAMHARLWKRGVGYEEADRHRIEVICLRAERALALKFPHGQEACERAERAMGFDPGSWSDEALEGLEIEASEELMRHAGIPDGLARVLLAIRAWRSRR